MENKEGTADMETESGCTPSLEDVRKMFENDRFATENGMMIEETGDGYAKCSMVLEARHRNAMGAVMGGASFTLADFAFAVAANWRKVGTVSLSSNITYLGTAKGERLVAEAVCVRDGRSTAYYRIRVQDELGNPVAEVTTTGFRKA